MLTAEGLSGEDYIVVGLVAAVMILGYAVIICLVRLRKLAAVVGELDDDLAAVEHKVNRKKPEPPPVSGTQVFPITVTTWKPSLTTPPIGRHRV